MEYAIHKKNINRLIFQLLEDSKLFDMDFVEEDSISNRDCISVDFKICDKNIFGLSVWSKDILSGYQQIYHLNRSPQTLASFLFIFPERIKRTKSLIEEKLKSIEITLCYFRKTGGNYIRKQKISDIPEVMNKILKNNLEDVDLSVINENIKDGIQVLKESIVTNKEFGIFTSILFSLPTGKLVNEDIEVTSAAYLVFHEMIFYRLMAKSNKFRSSFELIDPMKISSAGEFCKHYIEKIDSLLSNNFQIHKVHAISFVQDIQILRQILMFIDVISPESMHTDYLGKIFHQLIPLELRKRVASYYTLEYSAYLIAALSIGHHKQRVCDPACGSGTLINAAYKIKKEIITEQCLKEENKCILELKEQLLGTDIMPFPVYLANAYLSLADFPEITEICQIYVCDSNKLQVDICQENNKLNLPKIGSQDVILMNPPFTRKQALLNAKGNRLYGEELRKYYQFYFNNGYISGKSPFYAYFLCLADRILQTSLDLDFFPEKIVAAILPAIVLRNHNERKLRKYLLEKYWIKYIIFREDACNFSEDTSQREIILIMKKRSSVSDKDSNVISYIFLERLDHDNYIDLPKQISKETSLIGTQYSSKLHNTEIGFSIVNLFQNTMNSDNLFYPASLFSFNYDFLESWIKIRSKGPFNEIKSLKGVKILSKNESEPIKSNLTFDKTSILIKDYSNFSKDMIITGDIEENWIIKINSTEQQCQQNIHIEKGICKPSLRYITRKNRMNITNLCEYVVCNQSNEFIIPNADWKKWNDYLENRMANCIIVDRMDFTSQGYHLLAYYSDKERVIGRTTAALKGLTKKQCKLVNLWFNSSLGILEWLIFRSPQRFGYCQHHIFTLENLVIIDENAENTEELEKIFSYISNIEFPSFLSQYTMLLHKKYFDEFREILKRYDILDIAGVGFQPREILDKYILKLLIQSLDYDGVMQLSSVLVPDILEHTRDINLLRKRCLEPKILNLMVSNLHYRLLKFILWSKMAMDKIVI